LSRKELQSFQLEYPIAGVWPRPLLMASAAPAAAAKVRMESIVHTVTDRFHVSQVEVGREAVVGFPSMLL
jgi:hypothetical protein